MFYYKNLVDSPNFSPQLTSKLSIWFSLHPSSLGDSSDKSDIGQTTLWTFLLHFAIIQNRKKSWKYCFIAVWRKKNQNRLLCWKKNFFWKSKKWNVLLLTRNFHCIRQCAFSEVYCRIRNKVASFSCAFFSTQTKHFFTVVKICL